MVRDSDEGSGFWLGLGDVSGVGKPWLIPTGADHQSLIRYVRTIGLWSELVRAAKTVDGRQPHGPARIDATVPCAPALPGGASIHGLKRIV